MSGATALTIGAISGAVGTATSVAGAIQQNRAIQDSRKSQRRAASIQSQQLRESEALERSKRIRDAERIRAGIRVGAASAGFDVGGSYAALTNQADFDLATNNEIGNRNLVNNLSRVRSGLAAQNASLDSEVRNTVLASISGLTEGLASGLQIGDAIDRLAATP